MLFAIEYFLTFGKEGHCSFNFCLIPTFRTCIVSIYHMHQFNENRAYYNIIMYLLIYQIYTITFLCHRVVFCKLKFDHIKTHFISASHGVWPGWSMYSQSILLFINLLLLVKMTNCQWTNAYGIFTCLDAVVYGNEPDTYIDDFTRMTMGVGKWPTKWRKMSW